MSSAGQAPTRETTPADPAIAEVVPLTEPAAEPTTVEPAAEESAQTETLAVEVPNDYATVSHLTRTWVQYGIFGFAILCIVIGAVEALFGR